MTSAAPVHTASQAPYRCPRCARPTGYRVRVADGPWLCQACHLIQHTGTEKPKPEEPRRT